MVTLVHGSQEDFLFRYRLTKVVYLHKLWGSEVVSPMKPLASAGNIRACLGRSTALRSFQGSRLRPVHDVV
jgi:hypothetical protein